MAETLGELRTLPDEEIIRRHDHHAKTVSVATQHYLNELARRDAERQGERMEKLTVTMEQLTRSMYRLTVVNVFIAAVGSILTVILALG